MTDFPMLMEEQQITKYLEVFNLNRTEILNYFLESFGFLAEHNRRYTKTEFLEIVVNYSGSMKTIVGASVFLHSDYSEIVNNQGRLTVR